MWDIKVFCYTPHTFSTHVMYWICVYPILYLSSSFFLVPKWLSVTSGWTMALLQKISSLRSSLFPHLTVSFPSLLKWDTWMFPLFTFFFFFFPTVEQRGHDRRVFTGLKLVSFSFVMVLRLCAGIRFCIKVLILDYSGGFLQPNMQTCMSSWMFSRWMLIVLKVIYWPCDDTSFLSAL